MHGGAVTAERIPEGGTRMTVRLPRRPPAGEPEAEPSPVQPDHAAQN
jgi:hypothetical protein